MCSFLSKSPASSCPVLGTVQGIGEVQSVIQSRYMLQGVYRLMEKPGKRRLNVIYNIVSSGDQHCEGQNTGCKGTGGDRRNTLFQLVGPGKISLQRCHQRRGCDEDVYSKCKGPEEEQEWCARTSVQASACSKGVKGRRETQRIKLERTQGPDCVRHRKPQ